MTVKKKLRSIIFIVVTSLVFLVISFTAMTERVHAQLPSGATGVFGGIIINVKYCNCSRTYRIDVLHPLSPRPKRVHYVPGRSIQCEYYNITRTGVWTLGIDRPPTPCLKWIWGGDWFHICVPVSPQPEADIVLTGTSKPGAPGSGYVNLESSQQLVLESQSALSGLLTQLKQFLSSLPFPRFVVKLQSPELPVAFASHSSCPSQPSLPPLPPDPPPPDPPPDPSDPQCSDGDDNDGDGLIDYPNDPDCDSSTDTTESPSGGTCSVLNSPNLCSPENLVNACPAWSGEEASQICNIESAGGQPDIGSGFDIVAADSDFCGQSSRPSFSWGLYQINLTVHQVGGLDCPSAFDGRNYDSKIVDCDLYNQCVAAAQDPDLNIAFACNLYKRNGDWTDWACTAKKCSLPYNESLCIVLPS